jgi:biotin-(acetyl-CoA carboxylase) ligase
VLNSFERDYRRWLAGSDLAQFLPYLREHSALQGRTVAVELPGGQRSGRVDGISPEGELLLRNACGQTVKICSGDVRVVPLASAALP